LFAKINLLSLSEFIIIDIMDDNLQERSDILRVELNEINMIMRNRMKSKCCLDEIFEELARKIKCKEIELDNLRVKLD